MTLQKTNRSRSKANKGDIIFYALILVLPLIQIGIFYFGVNLQSILMAFQEYKTSTNTYVFNIMSNINLFIKDVTNLEFWIMIANSFVLWAVTCLLGSTLAVLFAYYIYKKAVFNTFFKVILFLPSILPAVMLVVMYKTFVGDAIPAFMLKITGVKPVNVFTLQSTMRTIVITIFTVFISFGPQVLIYTGAMDQIDPSIIEAGALDGVKPMREFWSIILPSIFPTIGTFLIAGVAGIFTNQNNIFSFLGTKDVGMADSTMGYYLYIMVYGYTDKYCYASFLGILCTIVVVPIAIGVRKIVEKVQN